MREAAIADGIQSLSPVVSPPSPPHLLLPCPSFWRLFAGTSGSITNGSWDIDNPETANRRRRINRYFRTSRIGLGCHLGFSKLARFPSARFVELSGNFVAVGRFVHYPRFPRSSFSRRHPPCFLSPATPVLASSPRRTCFTPPPSFSSSGVVD